jgi:putative SOS response-associated peptidase YedK
MCGRFSLKYRLNKLLEELAFLAAEEYAYELAWEPNHNICPTQNVLAIREQAGKIQLCKLRWGLIPSWSKDPKIGASLINARAETVAEKPSFRSAYKKRRCLIPADAFYEWQALPGVKKKVPHRISIVAKPNGDDTLFQFAGLWETWRGDDGTTLETCTIITTAANEFMQPLHNRMPVIVAREDYRRWLDPASDPMALTTLLVPYAGHDMHEEVVSL